MTREETAPILAFCAATVLVVATMVAVAQRPPETHYEAGPLPEPISQALSPDFLLGDLLDARADAAERKAERRAEARRQPRFVLPFSSAASSSSEVSRVAAPAQPTRRTSRTSSGGSGSGATTTRHQRPGSGSTPAPGRAKHGKARAPGHAHGHRKQRATTQKVETRRLSSSPGKGPAKGSHDHHGKRASRR